MKKQPSAPNKTSMVKIENRRICVEFDEENGNILQIKRITSRRKKEQQ